MKQLPQLLTWAFHEATSLPVMATTGSIVICLKVSVTKRLGEMNWKTTRNRMKLERDMWAIE